MSLWVCGDYATSSCVSAYQCVCVWDRYAVCDENINMDKAKRLLEVEIPCGYILHSDLYQS